MDWESILEKSAWLVADACLFALFYRLYKDQSNCLKELENAQHLELNSELIKKLQNNGGCIPYAVITGKVKALSKPLFSERFDLLRGVIREKITDEHQIKWIPGLCIWSTTNKNINKQVANVPFGLCGKGGLFQKKICVEITDPFSAKELTLSEVFDDFKKYDESVGEAIMGAFSREHVVGVREIESMLLEDTSLTAIGKLTVENDCIKIGVPSSNLTYFLTPLSYDSLVKKISVLEKICKGFTVVTVVIGAVILAYILKKGYVEIRKRITNARNLKKLQEARKLKRETNPSGPSEIGNNPKCVVCLDNPVEIIVLECGHACLCLNCSEQTWNFCPICRSSVHRLIPVFMP